jgi:antitoxin FitA
MPLGQGGYHYYTKMVSRCPRMSTSITLKNIPEPIYQRIKLAAKRHHRSMNNEIIACLEQVLAPQPFDTEARLEEARKLRGQFAGPVLKLEDIAGAIERERE